VTTSNPIQPTNSTTASTRPLKLLIIAGARPNFMKIAPLIKAAQAHNAKAVDGERRIECRLVHTGQHYDQKMSDIFFEELGIPAPDVNLEVGSGSHAAQTANIMLKFEPVLENEKPDWLVVVGDVNSTMACTLVAAKMGIKVAHVEAGLRSGDRTMPEEINRLVTDSIADLLLTPSEDGSENLRREGVAEEKIVMVGNIMIDSLISNLDKAEKAGTLERLNLKPKGFIYVTLHRPSNVDAKESLRTIIESLGHVAAKYPVIFPIHPRTRGRMEQFGIKLPVGADVRLIEPVGYFDSLMLTRYARCVLTDSGGLQEESTFFQTPCLTLRPNTERPVTVTLGSNKLTSIRALSDDLGAVLTGPPRTGAIPPHWDGKTSQRTLASLIRNL
jgi:UDP-N-acetylglucosamine 2-epimerase (non-hydrolysing)